MIEVVGGTYEELCRYPGWHQFFGSGGRAAAAITTLGGTARLYTFSQVAMESRRRALADAFGFDVVVTSGAPEVKFEYFHALTPVQYIPSFEPLSNSGRRIEVRGDAVLRFGMLEGEGVVTAKRCVYDPQSPVEPRPFEANGSTADELAIVCNLGEARQLSGCEEPSACAAALAQRTSVAVVKAGAAGAWVATSGSTATVPSYRTAMVFPIGSGDVFTAAFAKAWLEDGATPVDAAHLASRATALYCGSMTLPTTQRLLAEGAALVPLKLARGISPRPVVYLAGPFFTMAQSWLVDEARKELDNVGLAVFSPFHDVGTGKSDAEIAKLDLEGLDRADMVLALLDGLDAGTLFEVGFATKGKKPVVCFASQEAASDFTMMSGTGATVTSDFATAIYATAWAAFCGE
jgi:nucleoside 2-deoxyribosyltransferase